MTSRNTELSIAGNFPEFFREDYPLFVEFVKAYYSYLDTTFVGNIDSIKDIDNCDDVFLENFRNQYASIYPQLDNFQLRDFIRNANKFYAARGNVKSFEFLFRMMFGDEITVTIPGDNLLRASDGVWEQEYFISVVKTSGDLPVGDFYITFENANGAYQLLISKVEILSQDIFRFYFTPKDPFKIITGQQISVKNTSGTTIFTADHIRSPSKLRLLSGGLHWPMGKIIKIPGSLKDTIGRVTAASAAGTILETEILEFGMDHPENQVFTVSPYKNKPALSDIEYVKTLTSVSDTPPNFRYAHTLTIEDHTTGMTENVLGSKSGNAAFQTQYISQNEEESEYSEVTLSDWLASRATFVFEYSDVVKTYGRFIGESGILQNTSVRMQDNYFYQAFSYEIQTQHDSKEYKPVLETIHPAGFKWFGTLAKKFDHVNTYTTFRTMSIDVLYLFDDTNGSSDAIESKHFVKSTVESIPIADGIVFKDFDKVATPETFNIVELVAKDVTKPRTDDFDGTTDATAKGVTKPRTDVFDGSYESIQAKDLTKPLVDVTDGTTEAYEKSLLKPVTSDTLPATDIVSKLFDKYVDDVSVAPVDALVYRDFTKVTSDITDGATDSITYRDVIKQLIDAAVTADLASKDVTRLLNEGTNPVTDLAGKIVTVNLTSASTGSTDQLLSREAILGLSDAFVVDEAIQSKEASIQLSDATLQSTETFDGLADIVSELSDTVDISDAVTKSLDRIFSETFTVVESIGKTANKTFTETTTAVESIGKTANKTFTETTTAADVINNKAINKGVTDTTTVTDPTLNATAVSYTEDGYIEDGYFYDDTTLT